MSGPVYAVYTITWELHALSFYKSLVSEIYNFYEDTTLLTINFAQ